MEARYKALARQGPAPPAAVSPAPSSSRPSLLCDRYTGANVGRGPRLGRQAICSWMPLPVTDGEGRHVVSAPPCNTHRAWPPCDAQARGLLCNLRDPGNAALRHVKELFGQAIVARTESVGVGAGP